MNFRFFPRLRIPMKRVVCFLLLLGGLFVFEGWVEADVLPPGKTRVSYKITIKGAEKFPQYSFVAYPQGRPLRRFSVLSKSKKDVWFSRYQGFLYAMTKEQLTAFRAKFPKGGVPWGEDKTFDEFLKANKIPRSTEAISGENLLPERTGLRQINRTYQVMSVSDKGVVLKLLRLQRMLSKKGRKRAARLTPKAFLWIGGGALFAMLLVLVFFLRRRRKQEPR